jgi:ATP-dependent protease HslVU (ClpYQ) peptidase subunit
MKNLFLLSVMLFATANHSAFAGNESTVTMDDPEAVAPEAGSAPTKAKALENIKILRQKLEDANAELQAAKSRHEGRAAVKLEKLEGLGTVALALASYYEYKNAPLVIDQDIVIRTLGRATLFAAAATTAQAGYVHFTSQELADKSAQVDKLSKQLAAMEDALK